MNRLFLVSIAFLVGGIALMVFGVSGFNTLGADISRFFTGSVTDTAVWVLVGGAVASIAGAVGLFLGSKGSHAIHV